jgi:hypothetical protein
VRPSATKPVQRQPSTINGPQNLIRSAQWFFEEADRPALRLNARAEYESNFSPEGQLDELEAIYREVIEQHPSRR